MMNNTGAQIQSIVSTINGLIAKVIELERVQKKLEEKINDVPNTRDIEQLIAAQLVGKVDRGVVAPPPPPPVSVQVSQPPMMSSSTIEGILAGGGIGGPSCGGAPIDFGGGDSQDIELVSSQPSTEKKKIIKKKK